MIETCEYASEKGKQMELIWKNLTPFYNGVSDVALYSIVDEIMQVDVTKMFPNHFVILTRKW